MKKNGTTTTSISSMIFSARKPHQESHANPTTKKAIRSFATSKSGQLAFITLEPD